MEELIGSALSWLGNIVSWTVGGIGGFFLSLFPDADASLVATIRSWGSAMTGFDLTFNVFYFIDIGVVSAFLAMSIVVITAGLLYWLIETALITINKIVEMIPVFE